MLNWVSENSGMEILNFMTGMKTGLTLLAAAVVLMLPASDQEANKLLPSGADRACQATAYAKAHGIIVVRDQNSWWWLRSPGASAEGLAIVTEDGSINASGIASPSDNTGIRPVIVVRIP